MSLLDAAPGAPSDGAGAPGYWTFYDALAAAQLAAWLPARRARILDLSGTGKFLEQLVTAGHDVLHVVDPDDPAAPPSATGVRADPRALRWLADGSLDAILAEGCSLSACIATEETVREMARVLRPGGRLLLCVDSLVLGLARLADQGRWAELTDVPAADVVLVPTGTGGVTRCFSAEELESLIVAAGLEVDWVRPRSVLSEAAVERALAADPAVLPALVRTEMALAAERAGEGIGIHLVASARRPG